MTKLWCVLFVVRKHYYSFLAIFKNSFRPQEMLRGFHAFLLLVVGDAVALWVQFCDQNVAMVFQNAS